MTSTSKTVYTDKLDDIVKFNQEGPKFKVGDNARIPKYKNIFRKGYVPS